MFKEIQKKLLQQSVKMKGMTLLRVVPDQDLFQSYLNCFPDEVVKQDAALENKSIEELKALLD